MASHVKSCREYNPGARRAHGNSRCSFQSPAPVQPGLDCRGPGHSMRLSLRLWLSRPVGAQKGLEIHSAGIVLSRNYPSRSVISLDDRESTGTVPQNHRRENFRSSAPAPNPPGRPGRTWPFLRYYPLLISVEATQNCARRCAFGVMLCWAGS
jgi:hypothetical protein